ncbi:MAG TPA: hypothetical protein VGD60_00100 [Candidatus Acidoferrales bacterium]
MAFKGPILRERIHRRKSCDERDAYIIVILSAAKNLIQYCVVRVITSSAASS